MPSVEVERIFSLTLPKRMPLGLSKSKRTRAMEKVEEWGDSS